MTWPNYSPACRKAVNDLLKQGGSLSAYRANESFGVEPTKGSYAWKLEREIERKFKVKHAVAVNSGTAGLHCSLVGAGITSGEVITSPYTFSATVAAILHSGATPVFADVDPYTFTISPETVKRLVNKRTRCILPVDIFGGLAPFEGDSFDGVPIIRDSCQAVGAVRNGKASGSDAVAAAYSFNGGKNVPAGEAGAMITNDSRVAARARLLMNHAENFPKGYADYFKASQKFWWRQGVFAYPNAATGFNYRMNELTACVAYHGLLELEERNRKRNRLVQALEDELCKTMDYNGANDSFYDGRHVWYVYPWLLHTDENRDLFIKRMKRNGIPVGAGYIQPTLQHYKAFKKYARGPLPVVEELSKKTLCILSTLTPDRPLSYAAEVAKAMRESLA